MRRSPPRNNMVKRFERQTNMEAKLKSIPKENVPGTWKTAFLKGECPACGKVSKFQNVDFGLIKAPLLTFVTMVTKPRTWVQKLLSSPLLAIECQNCKHTMAYCENCKLGYSVDPYAPLSQCPSCHKEYCGWG